MYTFCFEIFIPSVTQSLVIFKLTLSRSDLAAINNSHSVVLYTIILYADVLLTLSLGRYWY